jgi:MscS family membrane protein
VHQPSISGTIAGHKHDNFASRCAIPCALLWLIIVLIFSVSIGAQTASKKKRPANPPETNAAPAATTPAVPTTPPPPDPLGRATPRGCVLGFLRAAENKDLATAAKYLDSKKSEEQNEELARQLKALLDRGTSTDLKILSRVPEGDLNEDLRNSRDRIGVISTPSGPLDVLLDRVQRPNEQPIWLFSQDTLRQVPEAYASLEKVEEPLDLSTYFPAWMRRVELFTVPLWRWTAFLIALLLVLLMASLLTRILLWLLRVVFRSRMTQSMEWAVLKLKGPTFILMIAIVQRVIGTYSSTALARHRWIGGSAVTALIGAAWLMMQSADIFQSYVRQRYIVQTRVEKLTFLGLLTRMFKIFVCIILVIILLTQAGINVSALVTGLGIGGVAIAFAAQKTLSDLFGGISIVMRGAVRVGDFCTIAGRQGTVEEIGISSLRMRTLDRTVVTIPNGKVAEMDTENFAMRDQFWLHQVFTLRFDTPSAVLQRVLNGMVQILKSHPNIDPTSARARLIQLTNAGPQVEVFAYYRKPGADFAAFLAEQEPIILQMMKLVEEEGTAMVAPTGIVQMPTAQTSGSRTEEAAGARN